MLWGSSSRKYLSISQIHEAVHGEYLLSAWRCAEGVDLVQAVAIHNAEFYILCNTCMLDWAKSECQPELAKDWNYLYSSVRDYFECPNDVEHRTFIAFNIYLSPALISWEFPKKSTISIWTTRQPSVSLVKSVMPGNHLSQQTTICPTSQSFFFIYHNHWISRP